jgi:hypothetical protein
MHSNPRTHSHGVPTAQGHSTKAGQLTPISTHACCVLTVQASPAHDTCCFPWHRTTPTIHNTITEAGVHERHAGAAGATHWLCTVSYQVACRITFPYCSQHYGHKGPALQKTPTLRRANLDCRRCLA